MVLQPDATREIFAPGTDHGGHDCDDGRSLRYIAWTHPPDPPDATSYLVDHIIVLRAPGEPLRIVHDEHALGLFPRESWYRLIAGVGLESMEVDVPDPHAGERAVFVARLRSS